MQKRLYLVPFCQVSLNLNQLCMTHKTNSTWLQTYCSALGAINTKLINHYSIFSGNLQRLAAINIKSFNNYSNFQASCSVCSAPAAIHLHYGAISCYSCRLHFFKLFQLFIWLFILSSPAISAGYIFFNSSKFSYDYVFFHLLLLLQVTFFQTFPSFHLVIFCRAFFRRGVPKQVRWGCYSTSVWFLSYHRLWAMCPRCIFGTGGCKITQQNRTNRKLCRYQVWYTIRQGNVTKKCCNENYGLLKCSFDRKYRNSIRPSQIQTKLNCFKVSPRSAMSRLFQEVLFQRCVETGMKPEKVNMRTSIT